MNCMRCSYKNPEENKFCGQCGAALKSEAAITLTDLMDKGILVKGSKLYCKAGSKEVKALVTADGKLECQGKIYETPLAALEAVRGLPCDGWYDWQHGNSDEGRIAPLWLLRHMLLIHRGGELAFPDWWGKYVQVPELHLSAYKS